MFCVFVLYFMRLKIQKIRCIEVRNHGEKMEKLEQRIKELEEQMEDVKRYMPQDQLSICHPARSCLTWQAGQTAPA